MGDDEESRDEKPGAGGWHPRLAALLLLPLTLILSVFGAGGPAAARSDRPETPADQGPAINRVDHIRARLLEADRARAADGAERGREAETEGSRVSQRWPNWPNWNNYWRNW
jgi:hypothetical protein